MNMVLCTIERQVKVRMNLSTLNSATHACKHVWSQTLQSFNIPVFQKMELLCYYFVLLSMGTTQKPVTTSGSGKRTVIRLHFPVKNTLLCMLRMKGNTHALVLLKESNIRQLASSMWQVSV